MGSSKWQCAGRDGSNDSWFIRQKNIWQAASAHAELDAAVITVTMRGYKSATLVWAHGYDVDISQAFEDIADYQTEQMYTNEKFIWSEYGFDKEDYDYNIIYSCLLAKNKLEDSGYTPGALGIRCASPRPGIRINSSGAYNTNLLKTHLRQCQEYGAQGYRVLQNGRIRYYGDSISARKSGEMAGRRMVREWDPKTGKMRTWHETLDHEGNIRQVRPEREATPKVHYLFDKYKNYIKRW